MSDARTPSMTTELDLPLSGGRSLHVALAEPDPGASNGAGVLVVHEALGLTDDMRRIAARFADHGYTALAPDFLGAGWKPLCIARFMQGIGRVGTGRPYRELAAAQQWLGQRAGVDAARIGVMGLCMGGGFALLYAARGGQPVKVVAPFYAAVPRDDAVLADLCPTVASYGDRDFAFRGGAARLEEALERLGIEHDVKTYPGAGHGFLSKHGPWLTRIERVSPMGGGYDETAAEDAWARMLTFFGTHLTSERRAEPRLDRR
jgi:carboxymethylenebutenolidase